METVVSSKRRATAVVVAGFVIQMVMWGGFYSFGVFLLPVAEGLGLPRGEVSAAYSVTSLVFGVGSVVSGTLVDRYGPRRVIAVFCLAGAAGYVLMAVASEGWHVVIALGVLGGVGLTGSYVPVTSTVARWFDARRGTMLGVVIAGNAVGGLLGPLLASVAVDAYGWRGAYLGMGLVLGAATLLGAIFMRSPRSDVADEGPAQPSTGETGNPGPVRQRGFVLLCITWAAHGLAGTAFLAHYLPHMTGSGLDAATAPLILSLAGALGVLGGALAGVIGDKLGSVRTLRAGLAVLGGAFALILAAGSAWTFWTISVLFGLSWFGVGVMVPLVATRLVGEKQMGKALGLLELLWAIGASVGVAVLGWVFDATSSYVLGWVAMLGAVLVGLAAAARLGIPRRAEAAAASEEVPRSAAAPQLAVRKPSR